MLPVFINPMKFVFKPIADMAIVIKYLLMLFIVSVKATERLKTVAMIDATKKYRINMGKVSCRRNFLPEAFLLFLSLYMANPRVMGMIAKVLVNLTIVAIFSVLLL